MTAKVALTYIVKDNSEKELFAKSLESFMPYFDGLYVLVTGTSGEHDEIHKLVKKYKGVSKSISPESNPKVYSLDENGKYFFSNFAEARNLSWSLIDKEYDYISWADTDDLFAGGVEVRNMIQRAKEMQVDMIFCTYWYANKFNGNGQVEQILINHERERFIKPGKYKWVSRLHEVCVPYEPNPKIVQYSYDPTVNQNIVWVHTADLGKAHLALQRNVRILEIQAEEENYKDPRTVFYLAKTYFDINTPEKLKLADKLLDDYIAVSGWDAEKANAYEYKGLIAHKNMQLDEAKKHYLNAIATYPRHHNPYLRLADVLFHKNEIELATFYLDVVEKVLGEYKSQATIGNPFEIKLLYLSLRYMVAFRSGNLAEAKKWALERHKIQPDGLLNEIISLENKELVARAFVNLATFYNKTNNYKALYLLLDNAPIDFREEGFLMQLSQLLPGKKWQDNEICYYASFGQKHFELWNGDSLSKGIGGSESAVIYLAEEWTRQGYGVTVYCDTPSTKIINGVLYTPYYMINWKDEFSTIIFWRSPHLLDLDIKAKNIFYDAHDIENPMNWTKPRIDRVSKVFFKSSWHRNNVPMIPNDKAVVISNGVTRL